VVERLTDDQCIEALDAYEQWGNEAEAAASLNIPRTTLHNRLIAARKRQFCLCFLMTT
jgi:transcriptional regulator of acetoin/glycerol metabolism